MTITTTPSPTIRGLPGPLSGELAYRLFGYVGRRASVQERDSAVHQAASVATLRVGRTRVKMYVWGSGPDVVLLVHGWHSRASALSELVSVLERPGRTIVAFDAPANGDSSGAKVTALDYAHVIRTIAEKYGRFEAIVAHSFGTLATFLAVNQGVQTGGIVSIAGVHSGEQLVDAFARQVRLPAHRVPRLKGRLSAGPFGVISDPWNTLVSELLGPDRSISLLVICDEGDRVVDPGESARIAAAHRGQLSSMTTHGLGHNRILRDPSVLEKVAEFVDGGAATRASAS